MGIRHSPRSGQWSEAVHLQLPSQHRPARVYGQDERKVRQGYRRGSQVVLCDGRRVYHSHLLRVLAQVLIASERAGRKGISDLRPPARPTGLRVWVVLAAFGACLGALNSVANHGAGPEYVYVAKVVGNDWTWLMAGAAGAWGGVTWRQSTTRALVLLCVAVVTYYIGDWWFERDLASPSGPITGLVSDATMWLLVALATSALLGLLRQGIRRGGLLGILATVAVPAYVAWRTFQTHRWLSADPALDPDLRAVTGVLWPVALAVTAGLLAFSIQRRTRLSRA